MALLSTTTTRTGRSRRATAWWPALGALLAAAAIVVSASTSTTAGASASPALGAGARVAPAVDGQIVFRRYLNAAQTKGALFVSNPDGTHTRQVTRPPKGWRDNVPAWSPDGTLIAFERFKSDDSTSKILVIDPDTGDKRTVVPCGGRCAYAIDPYFTPNGKAVAYSRTVTPGGDRPPEWALYSAIFAVDLDGGGGSRQLTATPPHGPGRPAAYETSDPTFASDGKTMAFIRTRYDDESSAVFVQPVGSPDAARRVSPWRLRCQDRPTFSPDGELVLFRCEPKGEEGPSNLFWVQPDGSGWHQVTHTGAGKRYLGSSFAPEFLAGEGWIAVGRTGGVGDDGNADVMLVRVEDGAVVEVVNLTRSDAWESAAGWGTHPPVS